MKKIIIGDKSGGTFGEICPDYGGMLTRFVCRGREIICCDENMLGISNLLAGGCPVLFPFASKTREDRYEVQGKAYTMPFHGLVKYAPFGVRKVTENSVTLFITNTEVSRKENYPYDYLLEITYSLEENRLLFQTVVHNRSLEKMPHYFGWHHYFCVTDKHKAAIRHSMKKYLDYTDGKDGIEHLMPEEMNLNERMDWVLFDKASDEICLESKADHYRVHMKMGPAFQAAVICSYFDGKVTLEPWIGIPDAIHRGSYVEWLEPGESRTYEVGLLVDTDI